VRRDLVLEEFKKFIMRGNVLDLAIGVILGGAFGKIVSSLVDDVIMPVFGVILGGINFSDLKVVIKTAEEEAAELAINYGMFLQAVVDFMIVASSIFLFIHLISSFKKRGAEKLPTPPEPSREEILLQEIRDILRQNAT
jgi:large conductance mechanosensitive channel